MSSTLDRVGFVAQLIICLSILGAFFGTVFLLLTTPVEMEAGVREVLLVLVGVLAGAFKDIVGYYFGSSLGSSKKTAALLKDGADQTGQ